MYLPNATAESLTQKKNAISAVQRFTEKKNGGTNKLSLANNYSTN